MELLLIIVGFVLLIKASDIFVDASVKIAKIFHMSEVLIGATIVAIGTTLPETMVSATSAYIGHADISFGNAIGSIVCNTALVSGVSITILPTTVAKDAIKFPTIFYFATFIIYAAVAYIFGGFSRVFGLALVLGFAVYTYVIYKQNQVDDIESSSQKCKENAFVQIMILMASAVVIAFASRLLVDNGIAVARKFHVPESVIGLTIIAFGTSLPEFTTAITSLVKGHSNLSIGNIIGANLFNLLNVTGIAVLIRPFKIPTEDLFFGYNQTLAIDIPVALIVMLIFTLPAIIKGKTYRLQGLLLLLSYIAYLVIIFKF